MNSESETSLREVMLPNPLVVKPTETLDNAANLFKLHPFHHLPVVEDDHSLVGMLSSTDLEREAHGRSLFRHHDKESHTETLYRSLLVREVMIDAVFQLSPDHKIRDAYEVFKKGRFRSIPIVEKDILVGIVTPIDIIRYLIGD